VLITRGPTEGFGSEGVDISLDQNGMPTHPAIAMHLMCCGMQQAISQNESSPSLAVELSLEVSQLRRRIGDWLAE
jgi:hypothetical protein